MEEDVFIPVGQLNELRTTAIEQLENLRISRWKRKPLDTLQSYESGEKGSEKRESIDKGSEERESVEKASQEAEKKLFKGAFRYIRHSLFPFILLKDLKGHSQAER